MEVLIPYSIAIVLFLILSAFFSASETAMTAISRARIYQLVMEGNKRAQLVSKMRKNKETLISSMLIGNNIANSAASALITSLCMQMFDEGSLLIAVAAAATLVMVFAEILPKTYAIHNAERVALSLAFLVYAMVIVFTPINRCIHWAMNVVLKLLKLDIGKQQSLV